MKVFTKTANLTGNALDVAIQDQDTPDISLFLGQLLDTFSLDSNRAIDDESFNIITTGATPIVGNFIFLKELVAFYQSEIMTVTPVSGNEYTIKTSMPLDYAFSTGATCELQNVNMAVNGSITPVKFYISPSGLSTSQKWDINRMIISMTMGTAGDDGLFGNIAKLTNGNYFRTHNGIVQNMFNARDNSDFAAQSGGDVTYPIRSGGGGTFGMRSRITFNGQDKRGVVKRLSADTSDEFQSWVRDNVTITSYRVVIQGQIVE